MNLNNRYNRHPDLFKKNTGTAQEVELSIVLGSPSKNCEGIGICRMLDSKYLAGRGIKCPHVPGFLSLDTKRRLLVVRFPKRFLTSQMVARHFCKQLFKVTESYRVPARFVRVFGIQESIHIMKGNYKVVETEEEMIVMFNGSHDIISTEIN